jgi:hypothetical protein
MDLNAARVSYADATAAVSRYYAEIWPRQDPNQRFRITAPVLVEVVIALRRARITESNYVFEPRYGETGHQTAARMRGELATVADGREVPRAIGHPLRPRPVAELVAGVAAKRSLPPEIAAVIEKVRPPARSVTCPACHARPNVACSIPGTVKTRVRPGFIHPARTASWAVAVAGCPECRAVPGEVCRQLGEPYRDGAHHVRIEAARGGAP